MDIVAKRHSRTRPIWVVLYQVYFVIVLVVLGCTISAQEDDSSTAESDRVGTDLTSDQIDAIRSRLFAAEADVAVELANLLIEEIEQNYSRFDESLVEPLTLLGDGQRQLGRYIDALESYDRARNVSRLVNGLHSLNQIDVLYREADTYHELGQIGRASQRHEYAFSIFLRSFEEDSVELLPGLFALADWYIETRNIFAARGLFHNAVEISKTHLERTDPRNIRALKGLARSYRLERFTPPAEFEVPEEVLLSSRLPEESSLRYEAKINDFARGEEALKELVKIEQDREGSTRESLAYAKLDLADWFLLFQKHQLAEVVYRDIWKMFADDPSALFVQKEFVEPNALYYPLGRSTGSQPTTRLQEPVEGTIEFSFDITNTGEVVNVEVVRIEPDGRYQDEFFDWMERARYRPVIDEGVPKPKEGVTLTHTFLFFPDLTRD